MKNSTSQGCVVGKFTSQGDDKSSRLGTATLEPMTIFLIRTNGIRPAYRNEVDIFLEKFFRHLSIYEQSRPLHDRFLVYLLPVPPSLWEDTRKAVFSRQIKLINSMVNHDNSPAEKAEV